MLVLCPHSVCKFTLEECTDFYKCTFFSFFSSFQNPDWFLYLLCTSVSTPRHRDGSGLTEGHTNYHGKSHSAVRSSRGKCCPASYVGLPSWHCLSSLSCDHQILVLSAEETGWSKFLVLQTLKSLQKEKLGMPMVEDTPAYCEDITNWGTCILGIFFLTLGSRARKQLVGKQRGKEQLFLWGPDRRNKNVGVPGIAMEQ